MASQQSEFPNSPNEEGRLISADDAVRALMDLVARDIEAAIAPLRDEITSLRQRLDDLERRQDPT